MKLSDSVKLPKDADGPVFAEPWEAQADRPYYESWLAALETLVEAKGVMSGPERLARVEAWDRAARATPHGKPIVLSRD